MKGLMNANTATVHKRDADASAPRSECGVVGSKEFTGGEVYEVEVEEAASRPSVARCGRCFEDGRGY